jgi:hypothetical protein
VGFIVGGDLVFCGSMVAEIIEDFAWLRPQDQGSCLKIM